MGTIRALLNQLVQLQDLMLIRDEQKVAGNGGHLQTLNQSIAKMQAKLPAEVRSQIDKLSKKSPLAIVRAAGSVCAGCGITLPISLVQQVRHAKALQSCPNCARYLYYVEAASNQLTQCRRVAGRHQVGLARFSSALLMAPSLASDTAEGVIRELAAKLEVEGFARDADRLVEAALQREAIVSTALEHGLAIPHARGIEGGGLTLALGLHRKGLQWDPDSGTLTRMVFFLVIPTAANAFYLKLLAGLTRTFMNTEARKAMLAEKEPEAMWKMLTRLTKTTVK